MTLEQIRIYEAEPAPAETYVYYTTQRPATPGAIPNNGIISIYHYDGRKQLEYCKAYSRVIYNRELTSAEINNYELSENNPPIRFINFPEVPQQLHINNFKFYGTPAADENQKKIDKIEAIQDKTINKLLEMLDTGRITSAYTENKELKTMIVLTRDTEKAGYRLTYFFKGLASMHEAERTPREISAAFNDAGKIYYM